MTALASLLQDIRYAFRLVAKSPAFSSITVGTLAVGIGASTALFSVVNGVLLNPLPFPQSSRLVALYEQNAGMPEAPISYLNFLDWQRYTKIFASMRFTGMRTKPNGYGSFIAGKWLDDLCIILVNAGNPSCARA